VLAARKPTFGTVYAYPKASEEAMQDVFFDVQAWLVDSVFETMAAAEAAAIISGDGSSKPTGFLHATPSSTADDTSPARADGALQYLATGAAAGFPTRKGMLIPSLDDNFVECTSIRRSRPHVDWIFHARNSDGADTSTQLGA